MDDFLNKIELKLNRIEEKINYMLSLMEELFADDEDKDEELEADSGNEGWITGLDSWKEDYEDREQ
jgi:hypothetical protein